MTAVHAHSPTRVLVTGGGGYIGTPLVSRVSASCMYGNNSRLTRKPGPSFTTWYGSRVPHPFPVSAPPAAAQVQRETAAWQAASLTKVSRPVREVELKEFDGIALRRQRVWRCEPRRVCAASAQGSALPYPPVRGQLHGDSQTRIEYSHACGESDVPGTDSNTIAAAMYGDSSVR